MNSIQTEMLLPTRNIQKIGYGISSFSGELLLNQLDCIVNCHGLPFKIVRNYRSSKVDNIGSLGRGWYFKYDVHIIQNSKGIEYQDELGRVHSFEYDTNSNKYITPPGIYAKIEDDNKYIKLYFRNGKYYLFDKKGGHLLKIVDKNKCLIDFVYSENEITIYDSFEREFKIILKDKLIYKVIDCAKKEYVYEYNENDCLTAVHYPKTDEFKDGVKIKYDYDNKFRLNKIIDPNANTILENKYKDDSRVFEQKHGAGTFLFEYNSERYETSVVNKNGSRQIFKHNNKGYVIEKQESLENKDIITQLSYNSNGELIKRINPGKTTEEWEYDENNDNPLNKGNLLKHVISPSKINTNANQIVTKYSYEQKYQQVETFTNANGATTSYKYDSKGNLSQIQYPKTKQIVIDKETGNSGEVKHNVYSEKYSYNSAGQVIKHISRNNSETNYYYYKLNDFAGTKGDQSIQTDTKEKGGYLAKVTKINDSTNEEISNSYQYDIYGNLYKLKDGNGNTTKYIYNVYQKLIKIVHKGDKSCETIFKYDKNGNCIEISRKTKRFEFDKNQNKVQEKDSNFTKQYEYDILNNVVLKRTVSSSGKKIEKKYIRNANEEIVQFIDPAGNITQFAYNNQKKLKQRILAYGSEMECKNNYNYTESGKLISVLQNNNLLKSHYYDELDRLCHVKSNNGTTESFEYDTFGNIKNHKVEEKRFWFLKKLLKESSYFYDEQNNLLRIDKKWLNPVNKKALGSGKWDAEKGIVSKVIEYNSINRPSRIWDESEIVKEFEYDSLGRISSLAASDNKLIYQYDNNGNVIKTELESPNNKLNGLVIESEYDIHNRPEKLLINNEAKNTIAYNNLNQVITSTSNTGSKTYFLHDELCRKAGEVCDATFEIPEIKLKQEQSVKRLIEYGNNGKIEKIENPSGLTTTFSYDNLNKVKSVEFNGNKVRNISRGKNGNITKIEYLNGEILYNKFDKSNRLVETKNISGSKLSITQTLNYNGLNRLTSLKRNNQVIRRKYDTLSRIIYERQNLNRVNFSYDSAGQNTFQKLGNKFNIKKKFNNKNQLELVFNKKGEKYAAFDYDINNSKSNIKLGNTAEVLISKELNQNGVSSQHP